jgi:hypothetical protein
MAHYDHLKVSSPYSSARPVGRRRRALAVTAEISDRENRTIVEVHGRQGQCRLGLRNGPGCAASIMISCQHGSGDRKHSAAITATIRWALLSGFCVRRPGSQQRGSGQRRRTGAQDTIAGAGPVVAVAGLFPARPGRRRAPSTGGQVPGGKSGSVAMYRVPGRSAPPIPVLHPRSIPSTRWVLACLLSRWHEPGSDTARRSPE